MLISNKRKISKFCFSSSDYFADELPCFSVDELWNEDELSMILNDDGDSFTGPPDQYSWKRGTSPSQSYYYSDKTANETHQSNSNVKSQTCDKLKKPLSSSQFITGSKAKVRSFISSSVGYSHPKEIPRRISHPLSPPPPTPGADDFEMTRAGSARPAYNENGDEELFDNGTPERIVRRQKWSSLTHDPLPDLLEKEERDILPMCTKHHHRRNKSSLNQQFSNALPIMSSTTTLEPLLTKENVCLEEESVPMIDDDFNTDRREQR